MKKLLKILLRIVVVIAALAVLVVVAAVIWMSMCAPSQYWRTSSLIKHINNPKNNWRSRWYAAVAIKGKGPAAGKQALYDLLVAEPPFLDVAPGVLESLGPDAVPCLLLGLKDSRPAVREASALWLEEVAASCPGTEVEGAGGYFMEFRNFTSPIGVMGNGGCEKWLATIGPALTAAIPELQAARKDENPKVGEHIGQALEIIKKRFSKKIAK